MRKISGTDAHDKVNVSYEQKDPTAVNRNIAITVDIRIILIRVPAKGLEI